MRPFHFRVRLAFTLLPLLLLTLVRGSRLLPAQEPSQRESVGLANQPDPGAAPDDTTVREIRVHWRQMFNESQWTQLDSVAEQLRNQRLRFAGGVWQLRVFYNVVGPAGPQTATDAAWEAQIAALKDWAQQRPASATPRIALADAYLDYAWKARGHGYGDTVTPEGWKLFAERVQLARETLESAQKMSTGDPEWFRAMQTVALAQGWPRPQVDALVDEALSTEPGYFYFASAEANYLLPKWYGKPGETEEFAARVADRIGGEEGDATYFLIASSINCCRKTQASAMVWARVKQGYAALKHLYGTNTFERNTIAFLAIRAGDAETAKTAFAEIGDDWNGAVWRSKARFDASRLGHPLGNAEPVVADNAPVAAEPTN